jgi:glycerol uptake operon antiterminator
MNEIDRHSTDMIEVMPGIMPKMVERFAAIGIPVIAGGLIETKAEITSSLKAGAVAVSTGKKGLWYL